MPAMLPAAAASTALGTGAAVGAGIGAGTAALGTGIATGTALAGGAGIFSNFMAGAAPGLAGTLGGVSAPVAASIAPAATSQLMGTIGGSVAPGAFGANLAGATSGLTSALPGATSTLPGMVNPAAIQAQGAKFLAQSQAAGMPIANANNPLLRSSLASGTNMMPVETLSSQAASGTGNLAETIRNTNTAMRGNVPISYAEGAQGIAPNAFTAPASNIQPGQNFIQNLGNIGSFQDVKDYAEVHPYATSAMAGLGAMGITKMLQPKKVSEPEDESMIRPYTYTRTQRPEAYAASPGMDSSERMYFSDQYTPLEPYKASEKAEGGIASAYAVGGPVEQMAAMNAVGANTGYPMANLQTPMYSNPAMQRPEATNVIAPSADAGVTSYSGEPRFAAGGAALQRPDNELQTQSGEATTEGGYKYSYDPNTMQFTQTGGPGVSNAPRGGILFGSTLLGPETFALTQGQHQAALANKPAGMQPSITLGPESFALTQGQYQAALADKNARQAATPNGTVSGGIATPMMQPAQPAAPAQPQPQRPATPINVPAYQSPEQQLGLTGFYDMMNQQLGGYGGYAKGGNVGGESHLGDYSDGGRLLKGPGDGVSDSIPASIGGRQPARLADGEFVIPARIVSELGNGSTEAGARKLYAMMDRIQKGRRKTVGKGKVAVNSKADKHLPA